MAVTVNESFWRIGYDVSTALLVDQTANFEPKHDSVSQIRAFYYLTSSLTCDIMIELLDGQLA